MRIEYDELLQSLKYLIEDAQKALEAWIEYDKLLQENVSKLVPGDNVIKDDTTIFREHYE